MAIEMLEWLLIMCQFRFSYYSFLMRWELEFKNKYAQTEKDFSFQTNISGF